MNHNRNKALYLALILISVCVLISGCAKKEAGEAVSGQFEEATEPVYTEEQESRMFFGSYEGMEDGYMLVKTNDGEKLYRVDVSECDALPPLSEFSEGVSVYVIPTQPLDPEADIIKAEAVNLLVQ